MRFRPSGPPKKPLRKYVCHHSQVANVTPSKGLTGWPPHSLGWLASILIAISISEPIGQQLTTYGLICSQAAAAEPASSHLAICPQHNRNHLPQTHPSSNSNERPLQNRHPLCGLSSARNETIHLVPVCVSSKVNSPHICSARDWAMLRPNEFVDLRSKSSGRPAPLS